MQTVSKKGKGRQGQTIAVYLSREQVQFLSRAAEAEETSVSDIVRRAVRKYFFLPERATISSQTRDAM